MHKGGQRRIESGSEGVGQDKWKGWSIRIFSIWLDWFLLGSLSPIEGWNVPLWLDRYYITIFISLNLWNQLEGEYYHLYITDEELSSDRVQGHTESAWWSGHRNPDLCDCRAHTWLSCCFPTAVRAIVFRSLNRDPKAKARENPHFNLSFFLSPSRSMWVNRKEEGKF